MTARPIIMAASSVRAILAGTKTQTRRIVKHRHLALIGPGDGADDPASWGYYAEGPNGWAGWMVLERGVNERNGNNQDRMSIPSPVEAGDVLWVRETWGIFDRDSFGGAAGYAVAYRADGEDGAVAWIDGPADYADAPGLQARETWRPSLFMPRWASRITLAVESVRVERVNMLTEDDAIAEGVMSLPDRHPDASPRDVYADLWDEINLRRGYPFAAGDWCWVYTFKRIEPASGGTEKGR